MRFSGSLITASRRTGSCGPALALAFGISMLLCAPSSFALDASRFTLIQAHAKLLDGEAILEDFRQGKEDTQIIIRLRSTAAAARLAAESRRSARIPAALDRPDASPFYDLTSPDIKRRLRISVTETIGRFIGEVAGPGLTLVRSFNYQFGFAGRVSLDMLERLANHPSVVHIEKDRELQPHLTQGIPLMTAMTPRSQFDGSGVSIAIVDTGIDTSHPHLGGGGQPIFNAKVIGGYDTGDSDPDPRPNSATGNAHGTACAGIAAGGPGSTGDYIGGVAPGAKLYALKISAGDAGSASYSAMVAAWEWAITHQHDDPAHPILIVSTSFGGGFYSNSCDGAGPAMTDAAASAIAAGITLFVSSGNDGYCNGMGWPACISHVNSVGALYDANLGTQGWCVAASSCANKQVHSGCSSGYAVFESSAANKVTAYSNSASFLTLFGPSNNAYTTDIVGPGGYTTGNFTTNFGGTSAATPYVAGAAAVLQSAAKAKLGRFLTPAEVRQFLTAQGDLITDGKVTSVTKPKVNLERSFQAVDALLTYSLNVERTGEGTGTLLSSPSGIHCGSSCSASFGQGVTVSLTATADAGSAFTGWTGAGCSGTATCQITMNADTSVSARFERRYSLGGRVGYWAMNRPVENVRLELSGAQTGEAVSAADGSYEVGGLTAGDYVLQPVTGPLDTAMFGQREGLGQESAREPGAATSVGLADAITAYDASLVLQHLVGLLSLSEGARVAADVNRSGQISALDASLILEFTSGLISLPFPGAAAIWWFDPAQRAYPSLDSDQTQQDFTAILLGDPSGNWSGTMDPNPDGGGIQTEAQTGLAPSPAARRPDPDSF